VDFSSAAVCSMGAKPWERKTQEKNRCSKLGGVARIGWHRGVSCRVGEVFSRPKGKGSDGREKRERKKRIVRASKKSVRGPAVPFVTDARSETMSRAERWDRGRGKTLEGRDAVTEGTQVEFSLSPQSWPRRRE